MCQRKLVIDSGCGGYRIGFFSPPSGIKCLCKRRQIVLKLNERTPSVNRKKHNGKIKGSSDSYDRGINPMTSTLGFVFDHFDFVVMKVSHYFVSLN